MLSSGGTFGFFMCVLERASGPDINFKTTD